MTLKLVLLSVLLVWNLLVLCAYGLDKSKAIRHKRRISEKVLLLQTLIFGGIGAFIGGRLFTTAAVREPGNTQTYASDVNALLSGARKLVPDLDTRRVVRAFAGGRPVIKGTNDFLIGQSTVVPDLFQAAGIQSPGVASAPAIAERMELVMREAGVELHERTDWNPIRREPDDFDRAPLARKEELIESDPAWGQIVCRCENPSPLH